MNALDEASPYRHETTSAHARIAALEEQLAALRGAFSPHAKDLASLRISHLREDRDEVTRRYQWWRSVGFFVTAMGMLGTFTGFFVETYAERDPALWMICAAVVTLIALAGWISQGLLRRWALSRHRILTRRMDEERVAAGLADSTPGTAPSSRVRVDLDPLGVEISEPADPLQSLTSRASGT